MNHLLQLSTLLLISALFFSCQPENPLMEDQNGNPGTEEATDAMVGKWNITRHSVVIKGGALMSQDAGYFDLRKKGEGEAILTYEGSKHKEKHAIKWSYDKDKKEISIDHKDGKEAKVYKVKDKTEDSQKWQKSEYKSNGDLDKMTEILLEK